MTSTDYIINWYGRWWRLGAHLVVMRHNYPTGGRRLVVQGGWFVDYA